MKDLRGANAIVTGASRGIGVYIMLTRAIVPAKDRAEVIVNTPPVRPLVVLANIAPGIMPRLLKAFGYSGVFERVMDTERTP